MRYTPHHALIRIYRSLRFEIHAIVVVVHRSLAQPSSFIIAEDFWVCTFCISRPPWGILIVFLISISNSWMANIIATIRASSLLTLLWYTIFWWWHRIFHGFLLVFTVIAGPTMIANDLFLFGRFKTYACGWPFPVKWSFLLSASFFFSLINSKCFFGRSILGTKFRQLFEHPFYRRSVHFLFLFSNFCFFSFLPDFFYDFGYHKASMQMPVLLKIFILSKITVFVEWMCSFKSL